MTTTNQLPTLETTRRRRTAAPTRTRWAAIGAAIAVSVGAGGFGLATASGDDSLTFVAMTPCRLIDTRPPPNQVGAHGTFGADDIKTIQASGANGQCSVPTEAAGLTVNATAIGATAPSFMTFWPGGPRPLSSSLNPVPDQPPTPNAVTVDLSETGSFDIYNFAGSVDLIVDVTGYYVESDTAALARRIDELDAAVAGLRGEVDTAVSELHSEFSHQIDVLFDAQPFTRSAFTPARWVSNTAEIVASVTVDAPVAGTVTVVSGATIRSATNGEGAGCSLTTGNGLDAGHLQVELLPGFPAGQGQISGVRTYQVSAGTTTVNLVCQAAMASVEVTAASLAAFFMPGH